MEKRQSVSNCGAIVIGADYRGLTLARSLGRRDIPVWVLAGEQLLAFSSRYASRRLRWPEFADEDTQCEYLSTLASRHGLEGWVLIPTSDEHAALQSRRREELLKCYRFAASPWEIFRTTYDKRLSYQFADSVGIPCPATRYLQDEGEVNGLDCTYPALLKPAIKNTVTPFTHDKAWRVENKAELVRAYRVASRMVEPSTILIQELITGDGENQFSFGALCLDGQVLASVVARRRRQYPIDFGRSSSFVESIAEPEIESAARRLLGALRYTGLIEVEFKRDLRDGKYKLLDLNPRVWGWCSLGSAVGVDFPYLFWELSQERPIVATRAVPGVRWSRMITDVPAMVSEIRAGRTSIRKCIDSLRGPVQSAVFATDDPMPALLEIPLISLAKYLRRRGLNRQQRENSKGHHRTRLSILMANRPTNNFLNSRSR